MNVRSSSKSTGIINNLRCAPVEDSALPPSPSHDELIEGRHLDVSIFDASRHVDNMIQHHIYSFLSTTDGQMAHGVGYMCAYLCTHMFELNLLIRLNWVRS